MIQTRRLGQSLKRERERRGDSLREVAKHTGVSPSTLSRLENGVGHLDSENLLAVTRWLETPLYLFVDGEIDKVASVPDEVEALLADDDALKPGQGEALAIIFRHIYNEVRR